MTNYFEYAIIPTDLKIFGFLTFNFFERRGKMKLGWLVAFFLGAFVEWIIVRIESTEKIYKLWLNTEGIRMEVLQNYQIGYWSILVIFILFLIAVIICLIKDRD